MVNEDDDDDDGSSVGPDPTLSAEYYRPRITQQGNIGNIGLMHNSFTINPSDTMHHAFFSG